MKLLKIILIVFIIIVSTFGLWFFLTLFFTEINPNYYLLEDGEKGYVMNTANMFYAFIVAIILIMFILNFVRTRLSSFIQKK